MQGAKLVKADMVAQRHFNDLANRSRRHFGAGFAWNMHCMDSSSIHSARPHDPSPHDRLRSAADPRRLGKISVERLCFKVFTAACAGHELAAFTVQRAVVADSQAFLSTTLRFGKMTHHSFGFAALMFTAPPTSSAGPMLPRALPWFDLFVRAAQALAALLWWAHDAAVATVMAVIARSILLVRRWLVAALNRATNAGERMRLKCLHRAAAMLTLVRVGAAGRLLARLD